MKQELIDEMLKKGYEIVGKDSMNISFHLKGTDNEYIEEDGKNFIHFYIPDFKENTIEELERLLQKKIDWNIQLIKDWNNAPASERSSD